MLAKYSLRPNSTARRGACLAGLQNRLQLEPCQTVQDGAAPGQGAELGAPSGFHCGEVGSSRGHPCPIKGEVEAENYPRSNSPDLISWK